MTVAEYTGYVNALREVFTQLGLKYRNRLQQGVKSEEMLSDLFAYSAAMRIAVAYDTADLALDEPTNNVISQAEIQDILRGANCIRIKYNVPIDYDAYIAIAEGGAPLTAIQYENGDYLLTEDGLYLLLE